MKKFALVLLLFMFGCSSPTANNECVITSPTNGSNWFSNQPVTWNDDAPVTCLVHFESTPGSFEIATNSTAHSATMSNYLYGKATISISDNKGRSDQVTVVRMK